MEFTKEQISTALNEAYKKAGHNAYFANGFEAGVKFAQEQFKILNIPVVTNNEVEYCECGKPTLGTSVSRCGTCNKWFKAV